MWNGKPVEKWTLEEKNTFYDALTGNHRHKGIVYPDGQVSIYKCACMVHQSIEPLECLNYDYYEDLSGFQTVKDFMESQMAETWEKHLLFVASNVNTECKKRLQYKLYFTKVFNAQLSLDNLITFLLDNTGWAWKECPGTGYIRGCNYPKCIKTESQYCKNGKVKHPALTWAEGLKEER